MRIPDTMPLREWIIQLIREGKLYKFYKTIEWLSLRAEVMADHHYECEHHKERDDLPPRKRYARADTVHHEFEVREFPHMALTRYIQEADGSMREVLHPLCNDCHNMAHGRRLKGTKPRPQLNDERW